MCRSKIHTATVIEPQESEINPDIFTKESPIMESFLDNVRSSLNVGSIFRTADGVGVRKLYLGGITPSPSDPGVWKTALGAQESVAWEKINNGVKKIRQLKTTGYSVLGLESLHRAESIYKLGREILQQPLVLIVGNERCGIDPLLLDLCDQIVSIPMVGKKRSYNVAVAYGIAVSYLRFCQISSHGSDNRFPKTRLTP